MIENKHLSNLRRTLKPYIKQDEVAARGEFGEYKVKSIYFDTTSLRDYRDKIEGYKIRKKLRIRTYNDEPSKEHIFFEIKRKNDNYISKDRAHLPFEKIESVIAQNSYINFFNEAQENENLRGKNPNFFNNVRKEILSPLALVTYDREAYFSKFDKSLRITFDKNICAKPFPSLLELFDISPGEQIIKNHFLLEIKFVHGYSRWLQKVINMFNLRRIAFSKYTTSLNYHRVPKAYSRNQILSYAVK